LKKLILKIELMETNKTTQFLQKKGKGLITANFNKDLEKVVDYWRGIGTVRRFKDKIYIQTISFPYTQELMRKWGLSFQVKTEL